MSKQRCLTAGREGRVRVPGTRRQASPALRLEAPPAEPARLRVVPDDRYLDWDAVYVDNAQRLYGLLFSRVGNRPDAEDLTAEVFLAALGPLRLSAHKQEVRAYLVAAARTVLAAHWRRTLGRAITTIELDEDLHGMTDRQVDLAADGISQARAEQLLRSLPERYRAVLELRFLQGCSVRETAAALGVTVANAKVLQHRALRMAAQVEGAAPR